MADPFAILRHTDRPAAVDPSFADRLRERVTDVLTRSRGAISMTDVSDQVETWPEFVPESELPHPTVSAYLAIPDARRALGWYAVVFGARLAGPPYEDGGQITHAGLVIGDSIVMLAEASVAEEYVAGETGRAIRTGLSADNLVVVVPDVDATLALAAQRGADVTRPPRDEPYGRTGAMVDPFGRRWLVQSR